MVDSVTLTCESDSLQDISIFWSRSPRPFSRHRLSFNKSSTLSSFHLDRSSPQFCENCEVFVFVSFPLNKALPSRHDALESPSPLHSHDDRFQYVLFGRFMELPFPFIQTVPSSSVSLSTIRCSSFRLLRWSLRWMSWMTWIHHPLHWIRLLPLHSTHLLPLHLTH